MSGGGDTAPELNVVLGQLRSLRRKLERRGVSALWVFGSVARRQGRPDSDIDLAIDFSANAEPSLLDIVHLKAEMEEALGWPVDLGERSALRPLVAARVDSEMVRVF